ncbi:CueP family metal-binding protein [Corynebacterium glyciniphilum]|uniref:CueP family metal-binding protein n=1 Tax=Corynebacterium glyciniphilum TaxID=1404244 RepID=UPI003DA126DE
MRNHRPTRNVFAVLVVLLGLFATACSSVEPVTETSGTGSWLADYNLDGLDAREITERLDALPVADRPEGLIASVEPETLVLFDNRGNETLMPLPADEFYLSFAPYLDQTHDCDFHSLTTCLGELRSQQFDVTVTEMGTNNVLVDETVSTFDSGFTGLWLPRDITATLTVEQNGHFGTVPFTTDDDAPTCITTLHLT